MTATSPVDVPPCGERDGDERDGDDVALRGWCTRCTSRLPPSLLQAVAMGQTRPLRFQTPPALQFDPVVEFGIVLVHLVLPVGFETLVPRDDEQRVFVTVLAGLFEFAK